MRINDFEKMQQNLEQMKKNLETIQNVEQNIERNVRNDEPETSRRRNSRRNRRAVEKEINRIRRPNITRIAKDEQIIVIITILIVAITFVFSTSIFAKTISENAEEKKAEAEEVVNATSEENTTKTESVEENTEAEKEDVSETGEVVLEKNENVIELEEILMENVSVLKSKEYVEEERDLEFQTEYVENHDLPKDEQVVTQEGVNGRQQVTVIKSYENDVLVGENILESYVIQNYISQIVDVGTSEFLANNKVHLGDTMYLTDQASLKSDPRDNADEIAVLPKSIDVTLLELAENNWCRVEFDGFGGYVKSKNLTSSAVTPGVVEANRIQRIKMTLSEDMPLNQSTDLTLDDYNKILSGNLADTKNVISDNAEAFYNADKNYNMNGVFLASMAIHESAWGTSTIADNKKNLFGYGAYDSSPYSSSFTFDTYAEGIDLVAKVLVKYYLNDAGTEIYDGEVAVASYYNGSTVADVNKRYASDSEWHNKIYKYMTYLYNRL